MVAAAPTIACSDLQSMDGQVPLFAIDSFIGVMDIEASETFVMVLDSIKEVRVGGYSLQDTNESSCEC